MIMERRKIVLVVDDEKEVLDTLVEGLEATGHFAGIYAAKDGREAIKILNSVSIDVLVTDLKMPKVNGFELLVYVNNHFPHIPAIIISSYTSSAVQAKSRPLGALRFLKKPIRLSELTSAIQSVVDPEGQLGIIRGFSLSSFLQLISSERKTCSLYVTSLDNKTGSFYFNDGVLLDAVCGETTGKDAAIEMLTWTDPELKFVGESTLAPERRIQGNLMLLLLEASRIIDEKEGVSGKEQLEEIIGALEAETVDLTEQQGERPEEKAASDHVDFDLKNVQREKKMNTAKLKEAIEMLKNDLGEGLLATDIISRSDGQAIMGYNTQPAACALFAQLTGYLMKALAESGFPGLGRYYLLDLVDKNAVIILPLGENLWGMLVDTKKTPIGLVLNVAVPKIISVYEDAITS